MLLLRYIWNNLVRKLYFNIPNFQFLIFQIILFLSVTQRCSVLILQCMNSNTV